MPSILWSAPFPPAAKHPPNKMLPPPCFTGEMVFFSLQASHCFLHTWQWSFWPNWSVFVSLDQRTFLQKVRSLSPCAVANRSLAFLWWFFLQHIHKVLCCCSGIDLHFSHQSTLISRRQNASPSWAVWWLRDPMVLILAYYCLYRWTWYLQAFGNCSQGWTRLVEVYNCFSEVFDWFLSIFPWCKAKRHWVWR